MKILLIGYGKMGRTIERIAQDQGHTISGKIDIHNQQSLESSLKESDVAIEFTTPETAFSNILACARAKVPVVSGTTGWLENYDEAVKQINTLGGTLFYASNYSIGVNIFFELNKYLARMMNNFDDYDVLMEEIHHTEKKDAPSGTAITLAEGILENMDRKKLWNLNQIGNSDDISVYSKRIGKVFGIHETQYHNEVDTIRISHEAFSREGFASGALKAAEWIIDKKGVLGMNDLLGLSE